ncbi:MAG TPA: PAS domain-containing sensor histidine kinase [Niastella sp.]
MENEIPNKATNQQLIQFIPDAAVFTNSSFIITAWNKAATTLFNYAEYEVLGLDISFLLPAFYGMYNQLPSLKNPSFSHDKIVHQNKAKEVMLLHVSRHAIAPGTPAGGYLFIYELIDPDKHSETFLTTSNGLLQKTVVSSPKNEEEHQWLIEQLRELSDHLLTVRETERTNIAREIHDELGQQLTILKMDISWLHQKLQKYEDASVLRKTSDTLAMLNETIKTVRRIATQLRPSMLDDLGLIEAMEWQSKEFAGRSGININFESTVSHLPVANAIATSLFRIYQEALTNIGRHAQAKNVYSKLQLENGQLILTIKDDGTGFEMQTLGAKKTLGILGMKERTLMMGGQFEITSKTGEGTTIMVTTTLPINDAINKKL